MGDTQEPQAMPEDVHEGSHLWDIYERALPKGAPGAWVRVAIEQLWADKRRTGETPPVGPEINRPDPLW